MPEETFITKSTGLALTTEITCLDLMSQLATGTVVGYVAGITMQYEAEGPAYGGAITKIVVDGDYIYVAGATTQKVRRYLKSDLSFVDETADYGGTIYALAVDDTHIYVGGLTTQKVNKYLKSDLSYVGQTADFGGDIWNIIIDDTHIYVCGDTIYRVKRYLKSDLSYVDQTADCGHALWGMDQDNDYIYAGGYSSGAGYFIRKYQKSDLSLIATSVEDYGSAITAIIVDGDYLYIAGYSNKIQQYLTSDLSYTEVQSQDYGDDIICMVMDAAYIYAGGATTQKIRRYFKLTLIFSDESADYGGTINGMDLDEIDVFIGGSTTQKVRKYSLSDTANEIIDDLLAYPMQEPAVTKGDISDFADMIPHIKADGQTILQVLLMLPEIFGGYMEVDNDRKLNWFASIGEDKGQQIRYRKNLIGIEREIDYTNFYNRIYAYGQDEDKNRIKLSDIQEEDYVEDTDSQTEYDGIFSGPFINFGIIAPDSLLEWALQLLEKHKIPFISYKIRAIDLSAHEGFDFEKPQLGSQVIALNEDLGINIKAEVIKIEYPDLLNPQDMIIEIANAMPNIVDSLASMGNTQKSHGMLLAGT
jgi:hypothetical protein